MSRSCDTSAEFHEFFERHYAELARFAHLLTGGETEAADDLASDALVSLWQRWDHLRSAEHLRYSKIRRCCAGTGAWSLRNGDSPQRRDARRSPRS